MSSVPNACGLEAGKSDVWQRGQEAISDETGTAPTRGKPAVAETPGKAAKRVLATLSIWASTVLLASVLAAANGYGADKNSGNASGDRPAAPAAGLLAPPATSPTTQPPAPAMGKGNDDAASLDAPGEWPQWGGPHRNGVSTEKGLYRQWPEAGPVILWRTKVGRGMGTPAVWCNEVYTVVAEGWTNDEALRRRYTIT